MRRYIISAGTKNYAYETTLPSVSTDLAEMGSVFQSLGYEQALRVQDPATQELRKVLGNWFDADDHGDDAVVLYYTGHGDRDGEDHFLLCSNSVPGRLTRTALRTADLVSMAMESGVRRLLLIVDTCYAGDGSMQAVRKVAKSILASLVPGRDTEGDGLLAFSVIAAARERETARDGAFTVAFQAALSHAKIGGQRQQYLLLEEVIAEINANFDKNGTSQHAIGTPLLSEPGFSFLPNPRYQQDLPPQGRDLAEQHTWVSWEGRHHREEMANHFGPRGRGTDLGVDTGHYFVGRTAVLRLLVSWLGDSSTIDGRGVVVTGSPGIGKSAVLGRLVLLSDPAGRKTVPMHSIALGTDPGEDAIAVRVHARHLTLEDILGRIAEAGGLTVRTVDDLVTGLVKRLHPLVIVIDALDEAGTANDDEPERIAQQLLRRLIDLPCVRLLVGTRPQALEVLGDGFYKIDLDESKWVEHADITEYARRLLIEPNGPGSASPYHERTAPPVASGIADTTFPNFLVTRLIARTLAARDEPLAPVGGWENQLPAPESEPTSAAGPAFEWALSEQFGSDQRRARDLLLPLAFGQGAGLPWAEVWPAVATAITGRLVTSPDIEWVLAKAGAHVVEALDKDGRSVYRLFHESFSDQLRRTAPANIQDQVVKALINLIPDKDWSSADPYIRAHLATHAAMCDRLDELVTDAGFLLAVERSALLRALPAVQREPARRARFAYEKCALLWNDKMTIRERASALQLSAHFAKSTDIINQLWSHPGLPWRVRWSYIGWRSTDRRIGLHECEITALAHGYMSGSTVLVTGDAVGTARMWNFDTGEQIGDSIETRLGTLIGVALLSTVDGPLLVAAGGGRVAMWDPLTGKLKVKAIRLSRRAHQVAVTVVAGCPTLAAVARRGRISVWDLRNGSILVSVQLGLHEQVDFIEFVTWQGKPAVFAANHVEIDVIGYWSSYHAVLFTIDGTAIKRWIGRNTQLAGVGDIEGVATIVTSSSRSASGDPAIREIRLPGPHVGGRYTRSVFARRAGRPQLATIRAIRANEIELWDLQDRRLSSFIPWVQQKHRLNNIIFLEAGERPWLAAASNRSVFATEITSEDTQPKSATAVRSLTLTNSACGPMVLAVTDQGERAFNLVSGEELPLEGTNYRGSTTFFGGGLKPGSPPALRAVWNYKSKYLLIQMIAQPKAVQKVANTSHGISTNLVAVALADGLALVNVGRREVIYKLPSGTEQNVKLPFSCAATVLALDGNLILVVRADKHTTATRLETGDQLWSHTDGVPSIIEAGTIWAGHLNNKETIILREHGSKLILRDARTGGCLGPALIGHTSTIRAVDMHDVRERPIVATGSTDGTVRVWDINTMNQVALIDVGASITALKLTPDGMIVVGTEAGLGRVSRSV
jgi:WD40 repeat protein